MDFIKTTVKGFFGKNEIKYFIPAYQRAYSWEEQQLLQFFEDIYECRNCVNLNLYCYGNVLLQTIKNEAEYAIIDGQQRLTTISIFIRSMLNEIKERNIDENIIKIANEEIIFFKSSGVIKLRPVEYDIGCYDTIIIENKNDFNCTTPSQKRMLYAKKFFKEKLEEINNGEKVISDTELINIYNVVKGATLNSIELSGNKESALMFELQNNRGKNLTNLEKLKSYLMYQMYVYSNPIDTETNIDYLSNKFDPIYTITNDVNEYLNENSEEENKKILSEDNILLYHSYAYSEKYFAYRNLNHTIEEFKKVSTDEKVDWIKNYVDKLYESYTNIKKLLTYNNETLSKLKRLGMPTFIFPFILVGMKNFSNDKDKMSKLFKLMEILSFRYKLVSSRADIRSRLTESIKEFKTTGELDKLIENISLKMNEDNYWSDAKISEVLKGYMYQNPALNYLLWEYEESLQRRGYKFGDFKVENESIEHISPQTENSEWIESGYDVDEDNKYTLEFISKYLNCLGNLMIISQSHNSSIGNKPFKEKLDSYQNNPLLKQQKEIEKFVENTNQPIWTKTSIENRLNNIVRFAEQRWSFKI